MGCRVTAERVGWYMRVKRGEHLTAVARDAGLSPSRISQVRDAYDFLLANPWADRYGERDALVSLVAGEPACAPDAVHESNAEAIAAMTARGFARRRRDAMR